MRTLKKALSLVLVLAMVFTLAVPALAVDKAADFTDYDKVTNKEAVDVLTAIGVINGNADGSFGAEAKFTRAQAATMIAYLTLGKTVADALPTAGTKFSDVPASFWGAKYIQYCADEGIINGYGDGKFGPDDELTSTQWALMLLGALGYKASNEGIGGTGWEISTTKLAMKAGVASAEDLTGTFNRDAAAKMAFNTLKATMVEYEGGSTVTVNGVTFTNGAVRKEMTCAKSDPNVVKYNNVDDGLVQFCEQHFPKLKLDTAAAAKADAFGRPANTWKLNNKEVGVYAKTADVSYTTKVTGGQLYTDLGKVTPDSVTVYVDGNQWGESKDTVKSKIVSGETDNAITDKNGNVYSGNGVLTEVYYDADNKAATIVVINTYVGTISSHKDAKKDANGDITVKEYVEISGGAKTPGTLNNSGKFETTAFDQVDATNGTVVLYTVAKNSNNNFDVKSVVAAESQTVTASTMSENNFTADGTKYAYSMKTDGAIANTDVTNKNSKVVYFDEYGYVIKVANPTASTTNYAVVVNAVTSNTLDGATYNVRLLMADGEIVDVIATKGAADTYTGDDSAPKAGEYKVNELVKYVKNSDGKYEITTVGQTGENTAAITKGTVSFTVGADLSKVTHKANSKTVFFVKTVDSANKETYKVYTGIGNVPTITAAVKSAVVTVEGYAAAVYVDTATVTGGASTSKDIIFITATGKTTYTDAVKGTYTTYNAVVNGTVTTVDAKSDNLTTGIYVSATKDDNGVITSLEEMSKDATSGNKATAFSSNGTVKAANGVVTLGNTELTYVENAPVYVVDVNGAISTTGITSIDTDANDTGVYYTTDGILSAVMIQTVD